MSITELPIRTDDPVPSTFDVPLTVEPEEDRVLTVLRNARDRYSKTPSTKYYCLYGSVCAVGALIVQQKGMEVEPLEGLEALISEDVVEAAKLLDVVAKELYPERMYSFNTEANEEPGARIEDLNQSGGTDSERSIKEVAPLVLHCYDATIERRKDEHTR